MKHIPILFVAALTTGSVYGAPPNSAPVKSPIPTNAVADTKSSISVQKMLQTGPTQLKMHSLIMIRQGNIAGKVDDTYLPGLLICSQDSDALLRSTSARILGEHFIANHDTPNPEALEALVKLTNDPSDDVRFNATYYGLTQVKDITPELAEQLIDIAATERKPELQDRIIVALANYQPQVVEILDRKLAGDNSVAYFEIYEEFTGQEPKNADKYLDMPSSRPHLLIIKPTDKNAEAAQTALTIALTKAGLKSPNSTISGSENNPVLILTTYITRDYQTARQLLSDTEEFSIMQDMWLTPELELQIKAMQQAQ
ncbi:HEAT repeat domain-containing protein [Pontiellaceae bacterium B12219]|nr:HEAT repeat domain-containing protein [Pontiellaceae bacterium B12219]